MNTRTLFVLISVVVVTMTANGSRLARAQEPACPPPGPAEGCGLPEIDGFSILQENGSACMVAVYTPECDSHTYTFDDNNSIKISTKVQQEFALAVELIPMDNATYETRVLGTPFNNSECWKTFNDECAFYRVFGDLIPDSAYGPMVEYIVGFITPPIVGNKHDMMLLRSSTESMPIPYPVFNSSFDQEITTRVKRNYSVGDDPGVEGAADGFSDYVVAHQRIRPVSQ